MRKVLITGAAGFIGHAVANRLLQSDFDVQGIDNFNDYYSVDLKRARAADLSTHKNFKLRSEDIKNAAALEEVFKEFQPEVVVNLAAQPGVRYSLENPRAYIDTNIVGFVNILEACRHHPPKHLVYASSSSVYGSNKKVPFSTDDPVDHPISLYAATKKSNELLAHSYSHLFGLPTTGLRFFTVYGPWGRPDMATWKFTQAILANKPIDVYNHGNMKRDFTYIDDIVDGVFRVLDHIPDSADHAPYRLYNIGNNRPTNLMGFIHVLESAIGKKAELNMLPLQPGDVLETYADIDDLVKAVGFHPTTSIEEGLPKFVKWYREYHKA